MLRPSRNLRSRPGHNVIGHDVHKALGGENQDQDEGKPNTSEKENDVLCVHDIGDSSAFVTVLNSSLSLPSKGRQKHSIPPMSGLQTFFLAIGTAFWLAGSICVFFGNPPASTSSRSFRVFISDMDKEEATTKVTMNRDQVLRSIQSPMNDHLTIIFSTDCSSYYNWQSYMLFFSVMDVKQPGNIIRIASGCEGSEMQSILTWHQKHIRPMSKKFFIHFTPAFPAPVEGSRKYFNKPFGTLHFLQYFEPNDTDGVSDKAASQGVDLSIEPTNMGSNSTSFSPYLEQKNVEKDVIILLEPDQILLRPITGNLEYSTSLHQRITHKDDVLWKQTSDFSVRPGKPIAQMYGMGTGWKSFDLKAITGSDTSPALSVSSEEAMKHYSVGTPCLATIRDMYRIAWYWSAFAPKVHTQFPKLLSEMYAYSIASAHLGLPHTVLSTLMISNQAESSEGWGFLDHIQDGEVCAPDTIHEWTRISNDLTTSQKEGLCPARIPACHSLRQELPVVLHYCQRYMVQEWFFGKRKYENYFTCESPILETPPTELGKDFDFRVRPGDPVTTHFPLERSEAKRSAFMICRMSKGLQDAARYFKSQHCQNGPQVNLKEDLNLFKLFYNNTYKTQ